MASPEDVFLRNAARYHADAEVKGKLVHLSPRWLRRVPQLMAAVVIAAVAYCALGTVRDYASAPAVVRSGAGGYRVVVEVDVQQRARLQVGMPLRFDLAGYEAASEQLSVRSIGTGGPGASSPRGDAHRGSDGCRAEAPIVRVEADLPRGTFSAEGRSYEYHEGMRGTAELQLGTRPLWMRLFPGLSVLFRAPRAEHARAGCRLSSRVASVASRVRPVRRRT